MNRMIKYKYLLYTCVLLLLVVVLIVLPTSSKIPFNNTYDPLPQTIHPIRLASSYTFAGEEVPLDYFDVVERLERELLVNSYYHSSTILHVKLAARYFPMFEKIFKENGIPDDMKYLAVAESSLRNAVSSSNAKGFWQFRQDAAKEQELEVNAWVDERNDPEKATLAAVQYLRKLKERFGSWTLAAAAYNMGPTALQRVMEEQKENSYYDLNLSEETNRYVFRILAIREIMKNPEKFGFFIHKNEMYPVLDDYKIITVDTGIPSLADFAHEHQITYRQLKLFNPWMSKGELPNPTKKSYSIKIPN